MSDVRLYPAWRRALQELMQRDAFTDGNTITKAVLIGLFELKVPSTAAEQEQFQIEYMRQLCCLRDELLEKHRIMLRTIYGESKYEVVPAMAQTDQAVGSGMRGLWREATKMARGLTYIRHEQLTDEERKKNADAQAKTAMLTGMITKPRITWR